MYKVYRNEWNIIDQLDSYEDLGKMDYFGGSFSELQEILRRHGPRGKWVSYDDVKQYVFSPSDHRTECLGRRDHRLTWWPDTGHLCFELTVDRDTAKTRLFSPYKPRAARLWSVFESGCFKGRSLPWVFFNRPKEFYSDYFGSGSLRDDQQRELKHIWRKLEAIEIPVADTSEYCVRHRWSTGRGYDGFVITLRASMPSRDERGWVLIDDRIDLAEICGYDGYFDAGIAPNSVRCWKQLFAQDRKHVWPRERCEAFFNGQFRRDAVMNS